MKNRPARSFVPLGALALVFCSCVSAAELCPGADGSRSETTTIETRLAAVPALLRIPPKVTRPPILLWHGFGPPESERQLMEAMPLDDVPAIKVYLGLPQFGAREQPDGREDMIRRQSEDLGRLVFEPVVVGAAQELPSVVTALQQLGCLRARRQGGSVRLLRRRSCGADRSRREEGADTCGRGRQRIHGPQRIRAGVRACDETNSTNGPTTRASSHGVRMLFSAQQTSRATTLPC